MAKRGLHDDLRRVAVKAGNESMAARGGKEWNENDYRLSQQASDAALRRALGHEPAPR